MHLYALMEALSPATTVNVFDPSSEMKLPIFSLRKDGVDYLDFKAKWLEVEDLRPCGHGVDVTIKKEDE